MVNLKLTDNSDRHSVELLKAARSVGGWEKSIIYDSNCDDGVLVLHDGHDRAATVPNEVLREVSSANKLGMTGLACELIRRARQGTGLVNGFVIPIGASPDNPNTIKIHPLDLPKWQAQGMNPKKRPFELIPPNLTQEPPMSEEPTEPINDQAPPNHRTGNQELIYEMGWNASQNSEPRTSPVYTDSGDTQAWFDGYDEHRANLPDFVDHPLGKTEAVAPEPDEVPSTLCLDVYETLVGLISLTKGSEAFAAMRNYLVEARNVCPKNAPIGKE